MTGRIVLAADDVTMRFGQFAAVDRVSLQVGAGEIVGLLGANGAGKTTLIRVLLGLLSPTQGTSTLMGGLPDREHRRVLGYVPQGLGLYLDLTVAENVAFVAGLYQVPAPGLPERLLAVADRLVRELPLGQQRQLAFVCALLHQPEVLVLDEPTSGVSAGARAELWDLIHEQSARGVGVLVTTHDMQEAQQCDRLLLMSRGSLVAAGSEADIIGDITAVAVRADDWSAAFRALDEAGQAVTLAGRRVRVADGQPDRILSLLAERGIAAEVAVVPATIEERMTLLTRTGS
jgi:ABC-2 type transport system ATP-binding protein